MSEKRYQKYITPLSMAMGVLIVLVMIWTKTFINQNSFADSVGNYSYLGAIIIPIAGTVFYYWLIFSDPIFGTLRDSTKLCAIGTAISGIILLGALLLELSLDGFSLFGETDIEIFWKCIPKKYVYDVWVIFWFPININIIFKAMKKEAFRVKSMFFGCIAITGITIEGILLFRQMANIYLIDMLLLNTVTIGLAVWKYVWRDSHIRKGNAIAGIILYALIRIGLLPLQTVDWGESIPTFMYGDGWSDYVLGVKTLVANASFFGTSEYLHSSEYIHEWLVDRNKPLLQVLYYGGWISVIILVALLVCLILVLVELLGIKNGREHRNWLVFATAATLLSERVICGTLFNFGVPIPVVLPFMGRYGFFTDIIFITMIFICAFENKKILDVKNTERYIVPAEEVLGVQPEYTIFDEDGDPYESYQNLLFSDEASIVTENGDIICDVDWYEVGSKEYGVFTYSTPLRQKRLFILERHEEKWILPKDLDGKIRQEICEYHMACKRPGCMEEMEGYLDESTCYEDD